MEAAPQLLFCQTAGISPPRCRGPLAHPQVYDLQRSQSGPDGHAPIPLSALRRRNEMVIRMRMETVATGYPPFLTACRNAFPLLPALPLPALQVSPFPRHGRLYLGLSRLGTHLSAWLLLIGPFSHPTTSFPSGCHASPHSLVPLGQFGPLRSDSDFGFYFELESSPPWTDVSTL